MTPPAAPGGDPLDQTTGPRRRWLLVAALLMMAATAGYVLQLQLWGSGGWQQSVTNVGVPVTLAFTAWSLAPMAGAAAVMVASYRFWPRGQVASAVSVAGLAAFTYWAFADYKTSQSSTAGLIFVFMPPYQWLVVGLAAAAAGVTDHLRRRRPPQPPRSPKAPEATTSG